MPSIRVLRNPMLPTLTEVEMARISSDLQEAAAATLGIDKGKIEVLWITPAFAFNAADIAVEIIFSSRPDLSFPPVIVEALAEDLREVLQFSEDLPEEYNEVSGWARPQTGAYFKLSLRRGEAQ